MIAFSNKIKDNRAESDETVQIAAIIQASFDEDGQAAVTTAATADRSGMLTVTSADHDSIGQACPRRAVPDEAAAKEIVAAAGRPWSAARAGRGDELSSYLRGQGKRLRTQRARVPCSRSATAVISRPDDDKRQIKTITNARSNVH